MKHPPFFVIFLAFLFAVFGVYKVHAQPQEIIYDGKTYYVVTSADPSEDSGNEVCAKIGKHCAGYTGFTNDMCMQVHPGAFATTSINGSKAGFYCDGPPQKGLACRDAKDTCQVCPTCDVNADCSTQIGDQFREMYAECRESIEIANGSPSFWGKMFDRVTHPLRRLIGFFQTLKAKEE